MWKSLYTVKEAKMYCSKCNSEVRYGKLEPGFCDWLCSLYCPCCDPIIPDDFFYRQDEHEMS
ncbi:MAG: hypothetical protein ACW980_24040 [Promethearchaeota archaeon]|jgi:hypothetical protein